MMISNAASVYYRDRGGRGKKNTKNLFTIDTFIIRWLYESKPDRRKLMEKCNLNKVKLNKSLAFLAGMFSLIAVFNCSKDNGNTGGGGGGG